MNYVDVVIENNSRHTDLFYSYGTTEDLNIGQRVGVTFGKGNREKIGYVFRKNVTPDCPLEKVKNIASIDENIYLNEEIISTINFMKTRYGIKYVDGVKCFIPKGKMPKEGKEKEPYKDIDGIEKEEHELTREQTLAMTKITPCIINNVQKNFLIHGVTGSGKTELYMQIFKQVLKQGKTGIMLVPEIALTKQIIDRFIGRFGKENIAVLHSKLTSRERFDEWIRIRQGKAKIVVGARLGVFAPLENIGAIILDEEHESTYKSDQNPKYETVDIALKRLMFYNGILVLGSATPSVVSYSRAEDGIYELIELKERYNENPLPKINLIDMKEEMKSGNFSGVSTILKEEIEKNLQNKKQVILFLNRRGYSTIITCNSCGEALKCPDCGIALTYHRHENGLICHYCGKKYPTNMRCNECGSDDLNFKGMGTEKVEEKIMDMFPNTNIARFDLDTAKNQKSIDKIINDFAKGKTDILIGTQLVAKGLDFKNVGLVGVISADTTLNIPDYRSTERTYQLVTQVAGRAGRGDEEGKVIVQTFTPDNFALIAAKNNDYNGFYKHELMLRKLMNYPPFTDLIMVLFTSNREIDAANTAKDCLNYIKRCKIDLDDNCLFEPKQSENFVGKDSYRYYVLIKSQKGSRNKYVYYLNEYNIVITKEKINCSIIIDVNPYSVF